MKNQRFEQEISDRFRLPTPTLLTAIGKSSRVTLSRVQCDTPDHGKTNPLPCEDTYVLHVMLRDLASAQLWYHGREVRIPHVPKGGFFLFHYPTNPIAAFHSPFDMLRFSISQQTLDKLAHDTGQGGSEGLRGFDPGTPDPILYHLARSILPLFKQDGAGNQLLLDHIGLAFHARLITTCSGAPPRPLRASGGLAPWQECRAKELMMANLAGEITLSELADECGISASHFSRAFRTTTGRPPHRWLIEQRVEVAKQKLSSSDLPVEVIAVGCGFSDASHFSRTFSKLTGETPSGWRRTVKM